MRNLILPFLLVVGLSVCCQAEEIQPSPASTQTLKSIVRAIVEKDTDLFKSQMLPKLAKSVTKDVVNQVHANYADYLKDGDLVYLGIINKKYGKLQIWKVINKKQEEDLLLKFVVVKDKCSAIFFE